MLQNDNENNLNPKDCCCHSNDSVPLTHNPYIKKIWLLCLVLSVILAVGVFFVVWSIHRGSEHSIVALDQEQGEQLKKVANLIPAPASTKSSPIQLSGKVISTPVVEPKLLKVTIKANDNLRKIFKRAGLKEKEASAILALRECNVLKKMQAGKKIGFLIDYNKSRLQMLSYEINVLDILIVTPRSDGKGWTATIKHRKPTINTKYAAGIIDNSIYAAGKEAGISDKLMKQFVYVFSHKLNTHKIKYGDRFALFYKEYTINGNIVKDSELLAGELVHNGKSHQIVGFTDSHGITDFYTPDGHSVKPPFTRYPVSHFDRIGSRFSWGRMHPILGIVRPHLGVDFTVARGTPVKATSNGRITFAGSRSGYGRAVIVSQGVYSTLYAHLSRFAEGMHFGKYVKQGQVIGYAGSSGLSTGPHVHYELRINGIHKDPLKVKLPSGEMISEQYRNHFFALSRKIQKELYDHRIENRVFALYPGAISDR